MVTNYDVQSDWQRLLDVGQPGHHPVQNHLLKLYYGNTAAGNAEFLMVTSDKPEFPEFSDIVQVKRGQRFDGSWALVLTLMNASLLSSFMALCAELIRITGEQISEEKAQEAFYNTLHQWRAILRAKSMRSLSEEQKRGLLGELWFCTNVLTAKYEPAEIIYSWHGPHGAQQDFTTKAPTLFEIKTTHSNAKSVKISSAEQLDPANGENLYLVLIEIEKVALSSSSTTSLSELSNQLLNSVIQDPAAHSAAEAAFLALGFDHLSEEYADEFYTVSDPKYFKVVDDFPRILRQDIDPAIKSLKYEISIIGFQNFEVASETIDF